MKPLNKEVTESSSRALAYSLATLAIATLISAGVHFFSPPTCAHDPAADDHGELEKSLAAMSDELREFTGRPLIVLDIDALEEANTRIAALDQDLRLMSITTDRQLEAILRAVLEPDPMLIQILKERSEPPKVLLGAKSRKEREVRAKIFGDNMGPVISLSCDHPKYESETSSCAVNVVQAGVLILSCDDDSCSAHSRLE